MKNQPRWLNPPAWVRIAVNVSISLSSDFIDAQPGFEFFISPVNPMLWSVIKLNRERLARVRQLTYGADCKLMYQDWRLMRKIV